MRSDEKCKKFKQLYLTCNWPEQQDAKSLNAISMNQSKTQNATCCARRSPTSIAESSQKSDVSDSHSETNELPQEGEQSQVMQECSRNNERTPSNLKRLETPVSSKELARSSNHSSGLSKIWKTLKVYFSHLYYEKPPHPYSHRIIPRVLLNGCSSSEEHYGCVEKVISKVRGKKGIDGLKAIGFAYEFIPFQDNSDSAQCKGATRLMHSESRTLITKENRLRYIADGEMYEVVVRLCQEYAQELMQAEGSLRWVSVCEDKQRGNPIRVLVDHDYPIHGHINERNSSKESEKVASTRNLNKRETLVISTGKGKVRAGVFSRQHLLISGIEKATALLMVRDAIRRNMSIAILDPNARGDRYGMAAYEQSMAVLFGPSSCLDSSTESPADTFPIYVLAHSASGAQLARYLQTTGQHIMSRLRSIAFTDSTHSIQWLKNHSQISSFFQSPSTLYCRSSNEDRDYGWERHQCGEIINTEKDEHWRHRFGGVTTIWAGTTDHSLSNYTSHLHIWSHFDKCRNGENRCDSTKRN